MIPVTKHNLHMHHGNQSLSATSNHMKKDSAPRLLLGSLIVRTVFQQLSIFLLNVGEDFVCCYVWNIVRSYAHSRHKKYTGFQLPCTDWVGAVMSDRNCFKTWSLWRLQRFRKDFSMALHLPCSIPTNKKPKQLS